MKKYSITFLIYAAILCVAYYGSYRFSYDRYKKDSDENLENIGEAVMADSAQEAILRSDTEYIIETYNQKTGEVQEIRSKIPQIMLGMNKDAAGAYADAYSKNPGNEELEDGFETMEVLSFSSERIIIRKIYLPLEKDYKYALGAVNGYVVVYYLDMTTVYEYTDIMLYKLPEQLQNQIRQEICRLDVHELYEFLENYSS